MRWPFIICGFAGLFCASYLDSVRGPLLPILSRELSLNYGALSWFLVATSLASVVSSYLMSPLLRNVSEKTIMLGICVLGTIAGLYSCFVHSFPTMILLAVGFGSMMAPMSTLANIFLIQGTEPKQRANFLCALHVMYGLGSILAPPAVAWTVRKHLPWNYAILFSSAAFFLLFIFASGMLSKKKVEKAMAAPHARKHLTPAEWGFAILFAVYVMGEVMGSMWLVTYMAEGWQLSANSSSFYAAIFFVAMVGTRIFCFFGLRPSMERTVLVLCLLVAAASFSLGRIFRIPLGISLFGLVGPFYPLFLARVSKVIPDRADSFTVVACILIQISVSLAHYIMGQVTDRMGIAVSYWLPVGVIGLVLLAIPVYFRWETNNAN